MDYEKLKEYRNTQKCYSTHLGIKTLKVDKGYAEGALKVEPMHYNGQSMIHGGVLFTLADTIGGTAAKSAGKEVVTVNANIEYLAPGENVETLYAYAKAMDMGNRISRIRVEIFDQMKTLLAVGNFTYYSTGRNIPI